jgi:hypothetical protein
LHFRAWSCMQHWCWFCVCSIKPCSTGTINLSTWPVRAHHPPRVPQVHGDLKPANVLLKSARSDRRGFGCKVREDCSAALRNMRTTQATVCDVAPAPSLTACLLSASLPAAGRLWSEPHVGPGRVACGHSGGCICMSHLAVLRVTTQHGCVAGVAGRNAAHATPAGCLSPSPT